MVMPACLAMQASPLKCLVNNELPSTLVYREYCAALSWLGADAFEEDGA